MKNLFRAAISVASNATAVAVLLIMTLGSDSAFAQVTPIDPSLEVFRIRCQIDGDIDPATGLLVPKVQIQAKARADLLDTQEIGFLVENISATPAPLPPNVIRTLFTQGSATADWDTFADSTDPDAVLVAFVAGDFVAADETIMVTAQVTDSGQTVTDVAKCADKTASQFKQQTKGVCKLKDFNRGKCKSGDILPDGTVMP